MPHTQYIKKYHLYSNKICSAASMASLFGTPNILNLLQSFYKNSISSAFGAMYMYISQFELSAKFWKSVKKWTVYKQFCNAMVDVEPRSEQSHLKTLLL